VIAYGEPRALRAGMLIEADVLRESRRLYEWALEYVDRKHSLALTSLGAFGQNVRRARHLP
jgi:hypothetical protein